MEKRNVKFLDLKKINSKYTESFKEKFEIFLNKGWYILGENVSSFEKEFSEMFDTGHSVTVNSGYDAL